MDIFLTIIGFAFILLGLVGSVLPILPGPPLSGIGLLLLHLTEYVPNNSLFIGITLLIAILIFAMDYIIPAIGTKKFGGSKAGMIGTTIGLFFGLFTPIPGGIIIGPFIGAFLGELSNKADTNTALKAAFGSFLGFITGTFLKFTVAVIYLGYFVSIFWENKHLLF
ncbi:putative membrane protein [Mesoflavibacter sp. HG96]|uniref:DUF456 domain-containing protein n=1 Tax=Mesoflavibacter TaxID=444051 RepID=UPI000D105F07|nr:MULTISPECIES: DUF456 domain-containing protein [Mesoflavibacter]QIJ88583.1 putative membrane protein [Mesoflavibacter sp. HG96]QIJ91311.1 putative membrane protein [Mesoflavibacter sp. HG37]